MNWILLMVLACGDKADDSAPSPPADTNDSGTLTACAALSPTDCGSRSDCTTLTGRPVQEQNGQICVDYTIEPEPLGCMDAEAGCGDAEILGASPASPDTCWWFPNTCLPADWIACEDANKWEACKE